MNFIRRNAFYVAMVGGLAPILLLILAVRSGPKGEIERMVKDRQDTENQIRGKLVNERMVQDRKDAVSAIRQKTAEIRDDAINWNAREFKVLTYVSKDGRPIEAFPVDRSRYEKEVLMQPFTQKYVSNFKSLVSTLRKIRPASLETDLKGDVEGLTAPAGKDAEADKLERARELARAKALLDRARSGWVYVTEETLDMVFTQPTYLAGVDKLWEAQVNLWVTEDIVEAIRRTNEQELDGLKEEEKNVTNAAVKRLVSTKITPYPGVSKQPTGGEKKGVIVARPAWEASEAAAQVEAPGLTGRTCNTRYDVVNYELVVVMSFRCLPRLLDNLYSRNYHTVRQVDVEAAALKKESLESKVVFYYGPDPVVQVTVMGEMLMLADWTRGTWDASAQTWLASRQPLMPEETLERLQDLPQSALRPEDVQRLGKYKQSRPGRP